MSQPNWIKSALACENFKIDTKFMTMSKFYFGDVNSDNIDDFSNPDLHLNLPNLSFNPEKSDWSPIENIQGNEKEFGQFFRYLIEKSYEHQHDFNSIRHYFWMRSSIVSEDKNYGINFPWYDSNSEFLPLFNWITNGSMGESFSDVDQGWELNGYLDSNIIYLLQTDGSNIEDAFAVDQGTNLFFNRQQFISKIESNQKLVTSIIEKLTYEIGIDVWSKYLYEDTLRFKTNNWDPAKKSAKSLLSRLWKRN